ncbi:MAG: LysM peptidoglycan-binding domain-containing protein [Clostridia bacterium]|nr:LysM peptidoglycan-binding domain-containing protein [Clostridia bacterium]
MKTKRFAPLHVALALLLFLGCLALPVRAATVDHTVVPGDTMWKTAVRYRVGLDEIIAANPQIKDPHWIYPGDVLHVPLPDDQVSSYERAVVDLVNNIRTSRGLGKLEENWELSRVARYKSRDMQEKRYFSHTSPTYGSPFDMMRAFGLVYRTAGENIAMGYPTPQSVVDGWMNSEGHRKNILNPAFTVIGVGYVSDGNYWTQMFIG